MKYVITWTVTNYNSAMKKFLDTGAQPPAGVKMLARYHALTGSTRGYIVAETADAKGVYTWLADWMDICSFEVVPVVEDADAAQIQGARK
jgi:hypothetical protein